MGVVCHRLIKNVFICQVVVERLSRTQIQRAEQNRYSINSSGAHGSGPFPLGLLVNLP
jgi:hypothetical protein